MKKLILLLALLTTSYAASAQVFVNDVNINELPGVQYISACFISLGRYAVVDYGQPNCVISISKKCRIYENGDFRRFNSQIDMLNYLVSNGWEYVETQAGFTDADEQTPLLFRRKEEEGY